MCGIYVSLLRVIAFTCHCSKVHRKNPIPALQRGLITSPQHQTLDLAVLAPAVPHPISALSLGSLCEQASVLGCPGPRGTELLNAAALSPVTLPELRLTLPLTSKDIFRQYGIPGAVCLGAHSDLRKLSGRSCTAGLRLVCCLWEERDLLRQAQLA
jgi:hypothetical protein